MKLEMQFKDYLSILKDKSNQGLSLDLALLPFGISSLASASSTLLVGHLLDYLAEQCEAHTVIDAIDVTQASWELGLPGSDEFLDEAPRLMIQMVRALVA